MPWALSQHKIKVNPSRSGEEESKERESIQEKGKKSDSIGRVGESMGKGGEEC